MNRYLKRGLVASSIAFTLVAIAGAIDIYIDPPVDVPSAGYYALGLLVKATLALSVGTGFSIFVLVALGSAIVSNVSKGWVRFVIFLIIIIFGSTHLYLLQPPKYQRLNLEKQY